MDARTLAVLLVASVLSLAGCGGGGSSNSTSPSGAVFASLGFPSAWAASRPSAISADGSVVVGTATTADGNDQAFRWSAQERMSELGFLPGGARSMASGVSADGSVVVGSGDSTSAPSTPLSGFRWVAGKGLNRIEPIPGSYLCTATGVSADGATVSGTCLTINNEAFRWTPATGSIGLGRFGGGSDATSSAAAISFDGAVIVGAGHPVLIGAMAWPASGEAIVIGKLPSDDSASASAVSRDGTVIVGTSRNEAQVPTAFRWDRQAGMSALGSTASGIQGSVAAGVSGDGTMIVGWLITATRESAFVWDAEHGLRQLETVLASDNRADIAGWQLTRATAISDDGRTITGYGTNPQGQTEGWIVKLDLLQVQ